MKNNIPKNNIKQKLIGKNISYHNKISRIFADIFFLEKGKCGKLWKI